MPIDRLHMTQERGLPSTVKLVELKSLIACGKLQATLHLMHIASCDFVHFVFKIAYFIKQVAVNVHEDGYTLVRYHCSEHRNADLK